MATTIDRSDTNFPYGELNEQHRGIRLFIFHLDMLHGRLTKVSLDDDEKYVALSYEWGDDKPDKMIIVNDQPFKVRNNLYSFLSAVTKYGRLIRPIFIDALCINQANQAERSTQVRLMPEIYTKAEEVRAWLGPLPIWWTSSPQRWDLRTIVPRREWGNFGFYILSIRKPNTPLRFTLKSVTEWARDSGLDNLTIIAARVAAQRPFWQRLWIVQELMLAKALSSQLRDRLLDAEKLLQLSRVLSGYDTANVNPAVALRTVTMATHGDALSDGLRFQDAAVVLTRKYYGPSTTLPLHEVLEAFAVQKCREPRDHIFGLLGLSHSATKPDYGLAIPQLYLYALVEGLLDVERSQHERYAPGATKVCGAVMEAYGWSMTDPTVHLLMSLALGEPGLFSVLLLALWDKSYALNKRKWPRIVRWTLDILQMLLLILLPLRWWQAIYEQGIRKNSPTVCAYVPMMFAYGAQTAWLAVLQRLDCEMAAPDGQVRTYAGWCKEVQRITALVREHEPLEPLSEQETAAHYPI
ncbi:hypothetical protein LTR56_021259 [Elasticomyces elasticus]|nr:hypothetical protein LTR56_021259 [Elasticomyces elasticus]KAK3624323.1 hypothetical protein LTR22_024027 [Elasticomyces elasticus]KAK4925148.1 hypothetical protein LTR49_007921 [Elasticomyces elasticus]KAK5744882.1 hypothetical protein LTS12_023319 [Elasticomyces elasticus]